MREVGTLTSQMPPDQPPLPDPAAARLARAGRWRGQSGTEEGISVGRERPIRDAHLASLPDGHRRRRRISSGADG